MTTATATSPASTYTEALAALSGAQKSSRGTPAYSRFVNRRLGRHLAAFAFSRGMSPNQVSAVSAMFSFVAIAVVSLHRPSVPTGILVATTLAVGYAWDSADGQLARLQGGGSRLGEWLDHMIDCTKIASLHLAVLISCYRFLEGLDPRALLLPLGFEVVSTVMFFGLILSDQLRRAAAGGTRPRDEGSLSAVRSWAILPTDYGLLCVTFLLLGWPTLFLSAYGALLLANTAFLAAALVKWWRAMSAIDHDSGPPVV